MLEGLGFRLSWLCILHLIQTDHSDPNPRDRLTQTRSGPPSPPQMYSDSLSLTEIRSVLLRPTQSHSDLRHAHICSVFFRFIQTHAASHSFAQIHVMPIRVSLRFTQIHSASLKFIQTNSVALIIFIQSHSDAPNLTQIKTGSGLLGPNQIHADSCSLTQICSDSCSPTQMHTASPNFIQFHSDSLKIIQILSDPFSHTRIHSA